jgi:hypothetical protein
LQNEGNKVKKLALTGHIGLSQEVESVFDMVLQKPIMPDQLVKSIIQVLHT